MAPRSRIPRTRSRILHDRGSGAASSLSSAGSLSRCCASSAIALSASPPPQTRPSVQLSRSVRGCWSDPRLASSAWARCSGGSDRLSISSGAMDSDPSGPDLNFQANQLAASGHRNRHINQHAALRDRILSCTSSVVRAISKSRVRASSPSSSSTSGSIFRGMAKSRTWVSDWHRTTCRTKAPDALPQGPVPMATRRRPR